MILYTKCTQTFSQNPLQKNYNNLLHGPHISKHGLIEYNN